MGLYSNAELIWGIPILAHDESTGEPTAFWSEENEDWREFDGLKIDTYGHYEDPDNQRAILTSERVKPFRADCWDPKRLESDALNVSDKVFSKSEDAARAAGLPVSFYGEAGWYLVASYG